MCRLEKPNSRTRDRIALFGSELAELFEPDEHPPHVDTPPGTRTPDPQPPHTAPDVHFTPDPHGGKGRAPSQADPQVAMAPVSQADVQVPMAPVSESDEQVAMGATISSDVQGVSTLNHHSAGYGLQLQALSSWGHRFVEFWDTLRGLTDGTTPLSRLDITQQFDGTSLSFTSVHAVVKRDAVSRAEWQAAQSDLESLLQERNEIVDVAHNVARTQTSFFASAHADDSVTLPGDLAADLSVQVLLDTQQTQ
jgi:hypothetical protein